MNFVSNMMNSVFRMMNSVLDVTPVTNAEIAFVCVAELLGMFMFVYTTNSVSALLRGLDAKRTAFQEHLDRIQEYMEARGTPSELQKRVVQYLTFINSPKCLTEAKVSKNEEFCIKHEELCI